MAHHKRSRNITQGIVRPAMKAQYNKSTLKTVAINLNLTAQYVINDRSSLLLDAGAWQELNRNNMSLSGISDIPYMEEFNIENPPRRNKFLPGKN